MSRIKEHSYYDYTCKGYFSNVCLVNGLISGKKRHKSDMTELERQRDQ